MKFHLASTMLMGLSLAASELWIETEQFSQKGGWVVDQQFMDFMGSSYLLAHGMGKPVEDAVGQLNVKTAGTYFVWAHTYNWTSPWTDKEGPGRFQIAVNGELLPTVLGCRGKSWEWQIAGTVVIPAGKTTIALHDLTGFDGRCDAVCLTTTSNPPTIRPVPRPPVPAGEFDFVVCGGGIAGICAAVSAARLGCRVALINDRPILGGCNSSEVRVHLGGRISIGPYPELGNLLKEFGPLNGGNAKPATQYEDEKKAAFVAAEKNITLFPNYHVRSVIMDDRRIESVIARHIETGFDIAFTAPLFADCTGDGTVGYLAKADYSMGREARDEYNEPGAPEKGDKLTMGSSVQWYSKDCKTETSFPEFSYGLEFNDQSCEKVTMGEWTWETGMNFDQINDFERIRDYGLLVVYSNWSYLKNHLSNNETYRTRDLDWVAYIAGKRESRRLIGDYVLTENDLREQKIYEDGTAATTWSIDLHYPDPKNTEHFPEREFKSIAKHQNIYPYPVPYRCLYSCNTDNLFMAGRNISVTHIALGTTRVMRTTGMLGEVVGMAADICRRHQSLPRSVYEKYLDELKELMKKGTGQRGLPNNQKYNQGGTLQKDIN